MATVLLVKTLATAAGTDARLSAPGRTVGEVLEGLCTAHDGLTAHLVHANGKVKGHVLLSVDGERVGAESPIGEADELMVLLATAGGIDCR